MARENYAAHSILEWTHDKVDFMLKDLNELREIEQLLRQAEERLGPTATFRQRTLLQMSLFEFRRGLRAEDEEATHSVDMSQDESDNRSF
ncbi:hypothetical protein [Methylorubrum podarium]|jgi:hypothetical protein|uniref:hypothetical protein n=1 Tax=Methylorubrum podarium TaxID=200476 RepID=UPI001EE2CF02|nr:hypothetical protein [Methylorubrum podarium]GJE71333.1 hypothetical protein CHKEEEPN_2879 [Methylorubrum podarium]